MCTYGSNTSQVSHAYLRAMAQDQQSTARPQHPVAPPLPERVIAEIIRRDVGVHIEPQVIRLLVKYNWAELSKAAHEIHGGRD